MEETVPVSLHGRPPQTQILERLPCLAREASHQFRPAGPSYTIGSGCLGAVADRTPIRPEQCSDPQ